MIDTFTLIHELPKLDAKDKFLCLLNQLITVCGASENSYCYTTSSFAYMGVLKLKLVKHEPRKQNGYFIKLSINPTFMLNPTTYNHIDLANEEDYAPFEQIFNSFIDKVLNKLADVQLPPLAEWIPRRIDYAVNVSNAPTNIYLHLFKKGQYPPNAVLNCRRKDLVDYVSSYYRPFGSFTINFYDKKIQLLEKKNMVLDTELMRLEVQMKLKDKRHIAHLLKLDNPQELYLKDLWNKDFAYRTLYYYISSTVGEEDFYCKDKAISKLHLSKPSNNVQKAIDFVNILSANKRQYLKAKLMLFKNYRGYKEYNKNYFKDNIKPIFKAAKVNPITIPSNYKITTLANPIKFLQELKIRRKY